jgi:hypothetical protein
LERLPCGIRGRQTTAIEQDLKGFARLSRVQQQPMQEIKPKATQQFHGGTTKAILGEFL